MDKTQEEEKGDDIYKSKSSCRELLAELLKENFDQLEMIYSSINPLI